MRNTHCKTPLSLLAALALLAGASAFGDGMGGGATSGSTNLVNTGQVRDSDGLTAKDQAALPWTNGKEYQDCGIACLYEKGNENLSLQAVYILDKIDALAAITDVTQDPGKSRASELLGTYCYKQTDLAGCKDRYIKIQLAYLQKIAAAIDRNGDASSRYKNGKALDMRSDIPVFAILRDPNQKEAPKKPQTPYVPTLRELHAQYLSDTRALQEQISPDYENWVRTQVTGRPDLARFAKTKEVDRDPGNPRSGKMTIIETTPDGHPIYDMAAYREEEKKWTAANRVKRNHDYQDLKESGDRIRLMGNRKDVVQQSDQMFQGENGSLFLSSRSEVLKGANSAIKNAGLKSRSVVSFPGPAANSSFQGTVNRGIAGRGPRQTAPADPRDAPVDQVLPRKDHSDFVTIILPAQTIRNQVDNFIKNNKAYAW